MYNPRSVFRFIADAQAEGQLCVLVTIAAVTGGSTRSAGAHLAVRGDGGFAGSISGGCVEAAVVAEALDALTAGTPRQVRFGIGSPYIDIRLPCGGGVDLLFTPLADDRFGARALTLLDQRQPIRLELARSGGKSRLSPGTDRFAVEVQPDRLNINHIPPLRLAIFGHGGAVEALDGLAQAAAADTLLLSPDEALVGSAHARGLAAVYLRTPADVLPIRCDPWTAAAFLFHDHDWEPILLARMLAEDAFFVGAMGSRKTHAERADRLRQMGVPAEAIDRIVAPIGLIPSMRDPETLAVSVLAQVISAYNARFLQPTAA